MWRIEDTLRTQGIPRPESSCGTCELTYDMLARTCAKRLPTCYSFDIITCCLRNQGWRDTHAKHEDTSRPYDTKHRGVASESQPRYSNLGPWCRSAPTSTEEILNRISFFLRSPQRLGAKAARRFTQREYLRVSDVLATEPQGSPFRAQTVTIAHFDATHVGCLLRHKSRPLHPTTCSKIRSTR